MNKNWRPETLLPKLRKFTFFIFSFFGLFEFTKNKLTRLLLFLYFGSRDAVINQFSSIISPLDVSIQNSKGLYLRYKEFLKILKPNWQSENEYIRIGSKYDGGYWITKRVLRKADFLVSGGIESNNDFEYYLARNGIPGIQIDNSVDRAPKAHKKLQFIKKTLGISENNISRYIPINSKNVIIKLDIEGAEYETLKQITDFSKVICLIVEFHEIYKIVEEDFWRSLKELLSKLKLSHDNICVKANNAGGTFIIGNQILPKVIEVTFVRKDLLNHSTKKFPEMESLGVNKPSFPPITIYW